MGRGVCGSNCVSFTAPQLVAMGTFMNPDTTRIVAKRVILTGHPFKVHKKTATIRYMFFNPGMLLIPFAGVVFDIKHIKHRFRFLKMMSIISNLFSSTRSMDEQVTFVNHWVHTGISRPTSTALSIKWTQFACHCTNGFFQNGRVYGPEQQIASTRLVFNLHQPHSRMKWKSNYFGNPVSLSGFEIVPSNPVSTIFTWN